MCNAAKHSPSCMCGFGPPYPPTYRIGSVTPWEEEVLDDPKVAKDRLRQAGYDDRSINTFAKRLAEVRRSPAPRNTRLEQIRELLGMRKRVAEETWLEMVDVPLYRFAAPNVKGAKVEYSEGTTTADGSGWRVILGGLGIGRTKTVEISRSRMFQAGAGEAKQVYVRIMVRMTKVAVYHGDRLVGMGYTAEVASPSESRDPELLRRGVRSLKGPPPRHEAGTLDFPRHGGSRTVGRPVGCHPQGEAQLADRHLSGGEAQLGEGQARGRPRTGHSKAHPKARAVLRAASGPRLPRLPV